MSATAGTGCGKGQRELGEAATGRPRLRDHAGWPSLGSQALLFRSLSARLPDPLSPGQPGPAPRLNSPLWWGPVPRSQALPLGRSRAKAGAEGGAVWRTHLGSLAGSGRGALGPLSALPRRPASPSVQTKGLRRVMSEATLCPGRPSSSLRASSSRLPSQPRTAPPRQMLPTVSFFFGAQLSAESQRLT